MLNIQDWKIIAKGHGPRGVAGIDSRVGWMVRPGGKMRVGLV